MYPHVFEGINGHKDISVCQEPLHASIKKYHQTYDPLKDYNPLISFEAVDEILQGRTAEESILICDIVIHWEYPHLDFWWVGGLYQAVQDFGKSTYSIDKLYTVVAQESRAYTLVHDKLEFVAHLVLARNQILQGFNSFYQRDGRTVSVWIWISN